ncbi:hypothetical protein B0H19DRAFT_1086596 [Mycena capillaripes]|nr:hypothetical protein B0H19DRAFT_1086596 [Mycena capillaripes]
MLPNKVILANGTVTTASLTENPAFLWVIRGSSSSFGIVTKIVAETFPALSPSTSTVLGDYQILLKNSPTKLVGLGLLWTKGNASQFVNLLFGGSLHLVTEGLSTSLSWVIQMGPYGINSSHINAVPVDATAYAHPNFMFTMQVQVTEVRSSPTEGFAFVEGVVNIITDSIPSDWDYGACLNYIDDRLVDCESIIPDPMHIVNERFIRVKSLLRVHYPRFPALKKTYDPSNFFRVPKSIEL